MSWNVEGRSRQVWAKGGDAFAIYFDRDTENAIGWPIKRDRKGEPFPTCLYLLLNQGWERVE